MEEIPHCSYYGNLKGPLLGDRVGVYCVDQAFIRLLEKYETRLEVNQQKLISTLRNTFKQELKELRSINETLSKRITILEDKKPKETKDATRKRKESKIEKRIQ